MSLKKTFLFLAVFVGVLVGNSGAEAQTAKDYFDNGNRLSKQGRYENAIEEYRESIKLNPNATVVYHNLGLAYKKVGRYEDAVSALEKAVDLEPFYLEAHLALGSVYNLMERWEDAIGHLNLAVHREPDNAEAHGNLGWAYYNYKSGPPFKLLTLVNLEKASALFEAQGETRAAEATRKVLREARVKFGYDSGN